MNTDAETHALAAYLPQQRAETVISACALRFDGYKWAAAQCPADQVFEYLGERLESFLAEMRLLPTAEENLAVFFYLQRSLRSGGVGFLESPCNSYGLAGLFLFLELRHCKVRKQWQHRSVYREWVRETSAYEEEAAQFVRKWISRRCSGCKM